MNSIQTREISGIFAFHFRSFLLCSGLESSFLIDRKLLQRFASATGYSSRRRGDQVNLATKSCRIMGTSELLMKNVIKKTAPAITRQRFMTVSVPERNDKGWFNAQSSVRGDDIGSCVAFNKPHLPPFLGPVVICYLLEMFNKDGDDK